MPQAQKLRPTAGTATGRVWEIADEVTRRTGGRARRSEVISTYVREGGKASTASTQFQHWKAEYDANSVPPTEEQPTTTLQVKDDGRIILPSELRNRLGIKEGDKLIVDVADGELRLLTRAAAMKLAQKLVRSFVPEGVSLVDQLIAERREEARRESQM